jgi:hypothetical protein
MNKCAYLVSNREEWGLEWNCAKGHDTDDGGACCLCGREHDCEDCADSYTEMDAV